MGLTRWSIWLRYLCCTGLWLILTARVCGQTDTSVFLREVEVTAMRMDFTDIGKHTDEIDTQMMAGRHHLHLGSLLSHHTPLFVRSYGNGTLSTLGIRGGSAAHTQLVWNGLPLRQPMLGMQDLALIPAVFIDDASVHYGGHGAAFGSGAVGGLISFRNAPLARSNRVDLDVSAGSWGQGAGSVRIQYGQERLRWSTRLFNQTARNNYRYRLARDLPVRQQTHHQLDNMGFLHEGELSIGEDQLLVGRIWYQQANRQIPPTSVQNFSQAAQQDESIRASVHWRKEGQKTNWQLKAAWMQERIDYQDTLILLFSENQFQTYVAEAEMAASLGPGLQVANGLYAEYTTATSANYVTERRRHQYAGFTSWRYFNGDWVWRVQAREEITDGVWAPLLIDLSSEWYGIKHLAMKASLSRNYRIPTLNDLHWMPGGNPELLPERGWTFEAGIHYSRKHGKTQVTGSATGYVRNMDQWIMWMPPVKDVRYYWSPVNLTEVHSKGLELRLNSSWAGKQWNGMIHLGWDLTSSVFGQDLPDFGILKGDQLFYVPAHALMTGCRAEIGILTGYYTHHWFSSSPGINEEVAAANVGVAGVSGRIRGERTISTWFFQVDNAWNVPYRIIERRPMPGRTITGGLKLSFQ